jgi:hypothetical protein
MQEEDQMEPEPHYEDFRSLRRKIFDWEGVLLQECSTAAVRQLLHVCSPAANSTAKILQRAMPAALQHVTTCRMLSRQLAAVS